MSTGTEATAEVDLGGRTVSVPRAGLFDRFRMGVPLDEIAADPRVPGVDFFRTLPKTEVQSPIGATRTPNFYYAMSSARLSLVAPSSAHVVAEQHQRHHAESRGDLEGREPLGESRADRTLSAGSTDTAESRAFTTARTRTGTSSR